MLDYLFYYFLSVDEGHGETCVAWHMDGKDFFHLAPAREYLTEQCGFLVDEAFDFLMTALDYKDGAWEEYQAALTMYQVALLIGDIPLDTGSAEYVEYMKDARYPNFDTIEVSDDEIMEEARLVQAQYVDGLYDPGSVEAC